LRMFPLILCALAFSAFGCASADQHPTTQPVMDIPAEQALPEYWYDQPDVAGVESLSFPKIWNACEKTIKDYRFDIDFMDWREGTIASEPMISKQLFEIWRRDAGTDGDVLEDSLQTIRRTVRFQVDRTPEGSYVAHPKVVIERLSLQSERVTAVEQFRGAFLPLQPGDVVGGVGASSAPVQYWYAIGRDQTMERHLADEVQNLVK